MGSVGEAFLFAVMFLVGALSVVVLLTSAQIRTWPAYYYFPELYFVESHCKVLDAKLHEFASEDEPDTFRPELFVEVLQDGHSRQAQVVLANSRRSRDAQLSMLDRYQPGESYPCWYDPRKSETIPA